MSTIFYVNSGHVIWQSVVQADGFVVLRLLKKFNNARAY